MTARVCAVAALAVFLPHLDDAPALTAPVMRACRALLDESASASVEDIHVLAVYLDVLARRPGLPEEARLLLLAARDSLLGRRVRNHRPRQRRGRTGRDSGSLTATMQLQVR